MRTLRVTISVTTLLMPLLLLPKPQEENTVKFRVYFFVKIAVRQPSQDTLLES